MRRSNDYVRLFDTLPIRVRQWVAKGRLRVSYGALRRWNCLTVRDKRRVVTTTKRVGDMDVALDIVKRTKGIQKIAARQRKLADEGRVPEYILNSTPPAYSSDLEAFFIPPDTPDRDMGPDVVLTKPIGRKLKRYVR